MPPSVANIVFAAGVLVLFALDRDRAARTSKALWLPVIWIWIVGSRAVSAWMGMDQSVSNVNQLAEGSPVDRAVFQFLLGAGLLVLLWRRKRTIAALKDNWAIVLYFSFCLISILWSDSPDVSFKRWTKSLGDLVMVLIVVTDPNPMAALRRVFSRVGFILLPASILLIKYYGDLGRAFDPYGWMEVTGVATDKNLLGVTTFVLSLGAVWRILVLLRSKGQPGRARHLLAQGVLLASGLLILKMAGSATSAACFAIGSGLMLATGLRVIGRRPAFVHALVLLIVVVAAFGMLSGADADLVHAMGRRTDFTGRTEIWKAVIHMAPNPMVGAGFETFWLGKRLEKMWSLFPVFKPNEAHDGYIEVYLNLGWAGLALIGLILVNGYFRAVATFRRNRGLGGLMLAFVAAATIYSVTEAGFRMLDPIWIFLLLAIAAGHAGNQASLKSKKLAGGKAGSQHGSHGGNRPGSRVGGRVGGKVGQPVGATSGRPLPAARGSLPWSAGGGPVEAF